MNIEQLIDRARNVGYHLGRMELVDTARGRARVRLPVDQDLLNVGGVIHGGAIATLVDDCASIAVIVTDSEHRNGVSTDLNVTQVAPAMAGATLIAEATVLRSGRRLAFVSVDIRNEESSELIAQGRLTKAL